MSLLTIVMPTHRTGLAVWTRILRLYAVASDQVQVIIRDNSGDASKRKLLATLSKPNFLAISVDPCEGRENFAQAFALADGAFIQMAADDDDYFERGLNALIAVANVHVNEPSFVGVTGTYILEQTNGSAILDYVGLNANAAIGRVHGYLALQGPNLLYYAAVRHNLIAEVIEMEKRYPIRFSFRDQLAVLGWLLSGAFAHAGRLVCIIDNSNWETAESAIKTDLGYYYSEGLDPILRQFHWLFCAFEGAMIVRSGIFGEMLDIDRQSIAIQWYAAMFQRFVGDSVDSHGSDLAEAAQSIRERAASRISNVALEAVLDDLCAALRLFSEEKAEAYRAFWSSPPFC